MKFEDQLSLIHKSTLANECNHGRDITQMILINPETIISLGNDFKLKINNLVSGKNHAVFESKKI
jgi:hypothetical protein